MMGWWVSISFAYVTNTYVFVYQRLDYSWNNLLANQKGYDKFKTTCKKLLARRIQICRVYFSVIYVHLVSKILFQMMSKKNLADLDLPHRILLCAKASGRFEVPQFVGIFYLFSGSQAGMHVLDNQMLERTSNGYIIRNNNVQKTHWKHLFYAIIGLTRSFFNFTKNPKNVPRVVFREEFKTGLGFEIRHRQQKCLRKPNI